MLRGHGLSVLGSPGSCFWYCMPYSGLKYASQYSFGGSFSELQQNIPQSPIPILTAPMFDFPIWMPPSDGFRTPWVPAIGMNCRRLAKERTVLQRAISSWTWTEHRLQAKPPRTCSVFNSSVSAEPSNQPTLPTGETEKQCFGFPCPEPEASARNPRMLREKCEQVK